ncbi:hypothetical protein [Rhizobium tropici]|uniref:Uncharacterized protein n=1 Tax=Rhizobium tropici TaxID=398 RepID=A0A329Y824_RHITR|nr:hypothetical protein [Rhizobium tropici]RAX39646.1 hypothetical protein DQ393_21590 [Rhizobium tropici]
MIDVEQVILSYQEDVPTNLLDDFKRHLDSSGIGLKTETRPINAYASFEWAVPTLIAVFILRSYFDAFFKEAGKDHYQILKAGVSLLLRKILGVHPENRPKGRSLIFSIQSVTRDGARIKFIFPEGVSHETYDEIVEALLDILATHYSSQGEDELSEMLVSTPPLGRVYYFEYSLEKRSWSVLDWKNDLEVRQKD